MGRTIWLNRSGYGRLRTPAPTLSFCLLLVSCASAPGEGREQEQAPIEGVDDAGANAVPPVLDAEPPAPPTVLPPPQPSDDCRPGRYDGMFSCIISGLLPWEGKMSFTLVAKTTDALEFQILEIVPGTRISGNDDSFQGMFEAELEGTFDCATGILTGAMTNGTYLFAGFMEYHLEGDLEGSYLADGSAPRFAGTMGPLTSKNFELFGDLGPSATCTWNAARTGDPAESSEPPGADAGL
jgi:hypothetical protein